MARWAMSGSHGTCRLKSACRARSAAVGHGAAQFAVLFFALDRLALVVGFFAAGDAEFQLGAAALEIDGQGDQRCRALGGFGFQSV